MNYINLNDKSEIVSFKQAVIQGIGRNKGLFVPEVIPQLSSDFFENILDLNHIEIAYQVIRPFISTKDISDEKLNEILTDSLSFETPIAQVTDNVGVLELFHGPTMAFKDVGARFMARCLGHFTNENQEVTVLVATSGDTGSAVAQGFHKVPGVRVIILFPKGKVSPFQEYQMTSLGENITAVEVDGNFDDCQALVKQALQDENLNQKLNLSTANSINVARFLPQIFYYYFAYKKLKNKLVDKNWVVSVPSGNFGNLTAGLYAKKMGLPIHKFIAANNENDTFFQYLKTQKYNAKSSISTLSNAMDVGDPSNFVRIIALYNDFEELKNEIIGEVVSDDLTLETIEKVNKNHDYLLDPHGAVGYYALQKYLQENELGTVLATASPQKFEKVIQQVLPDFPSKKVDLALCKKIEIDNDFDAYSQIIVG